MPATVTFAVAAIVADGTVAVAVSADPAIAIAAIDINTVATAIMAAAADSTQWRELQSLLWGNTRPLPPAAGSSDGIIVATLGCLDG